MLKGNQKQIVLQDANTPPVAAPGNMDFFFSSSSNGKLQMERTLFLSWLWQHMLNVSSGKRAEAFLQSFLELFSLASVGNWWWEALAHVPQILLTVHLSVLSRELLAK